jgi:lipoyl(octanoyl) transferase
MATSLPSSPTAEWIWLGRVSFDQAAALQERLRDKVLSGEGPETLLLCEHDPVVTLGRHARPEHVLVAEAQLERNGIAVRRATRGGDVTYHGPGQLVGYPVFRLRRGLVAHMESMASALLLALAQLGIVAEWRRACPGVWVGDRKIGAFGVHVRRRVAVHGFALNGDVDLGAFDAIVPCGLRGAGVTSVERLRGASPPLPELAALVAAAFQQSYGFVIANRDAQSIE